MKILLTLAAILLTACGIVDNIRDSAREVQQKINPEPPKDTIFIPIRDSTSEPRPPKP